MFIKNFRKLLLFRKKCDKIRKEDYFSKKEVIFVRRMKMVILDLKLDNFYAFKNFHMSMTYPKKIIGSCIEEEHLAGRSNFRYKKINIIMGANASGKTTLGHALMKIFNFIDKKNYEFITRIICDQTKEASFMLDIATNDNVLYNISCKIPPREGENYTASDICLEIRSANIWVNDSYESCISRMKKASYSFNGNYIEELEKMAKLDWMFEYPKDTERKVIIPKNDDKFQIVLEKILRALDPSINCVEKSQDVDNAYVIRIKEKAIILQDGESFDTNILSSGTKAGVEVAKVVSTLIQGKNTFYYCDEKFSYIHSEIEKAILSLMIDSMGSNSQMFFTTHNTDMLDLNLPKHSFTFLTKDANNDSCPINCISASSFLKKSSDSLKNAVENDLFCTAPSVDLIYDIAEL